MVQSNSRSMLLHAPHNSILLGGGMAVRAAHNEINLGGKNPLCSEERVDSHSYGGRIVARSALVVRSMAFPRVQLHIRTHTLYLSITWCSNGRSSMITHHSGSTFTLLSLAHLQALYRFTCLVYGSPLNPNQEARYRSSRYLALQKNSSRT